MDWTSHRSQLGMRFLTLRIVPWYSHAVWFCPHLRIRIRKLLGCLSIPALAGKRAAAAAKSTTFWQLLKGTGWRQKWWRGKEPPQLSSIPRWPAAQHLFWGELGFWESSLGNSLAWWLLPQKYPVSRSSCGTIHSEGAGFQLGKAVWLPSHEACPSGCLSHSTVGAAGWDGQKAHLCFLRAKLSAYVPLSWAGYPGSLFP